MRSNLSRGTSTMRRVPTPDKVLMSKRATVKYQNEGVSCSAKRREERKGVDASQLLPGAFFLQRRWRASLFCRTDWGLLLVVGLVPLLRAN